MAEITREWIADNAVDASKINIGQNTYLKGRNALDSADVNIVKVNASDKLEFASVPQVTSDASANNDLTRKSYVTGLLGSYQLTSEKGANSGYASLDAGGKVPASQLPSSIMDYKGTWAASTNTPTLADGTGNAGDVYVSTDAGTVNFGAGNITFAAGDWVIYSGSIWEKSINSNAVASVNGQTGAVSLNSDNIGEGSTNLYYTSTRFNSAFSAKTTTDLTEGTNLYYTSGRFDTAFSGKSTTNLSEGTNLYFTDARAKSAAVVNSTAGTETDQAASVSAMKSYVSTAIGAIQGAAAGEETFMLSAQNITDQFVDLAFVALAGSVLVFPKGGPVQVLTDDYTISYTGGVGSKTRISFAGDLATKLVAGAKLIVKYMKA